MFATYLGSVLHPCGTQNRAVFWPFGKRVMELLILDKKERGAESQYYSGESGESRG